ncbi:hypothetical protein [Planococcus koreensis]|uniref:hypothetical protein n=1 Tax=Planococcus koreensis TaxID=112331 RepID=UPI0010818F73|nr:hypothetical protein [Planococcus koreensis]
MENLMKRSVVIAIILLTVAQSFFYSVAAASVQPWSGNSWTGDTWSGDTWEGTPWQGNTWTGDTWQGDTWQGDGTSGDGTSGDGTSGDGTSGDGTSGDGTSGDGTSGDSTSGDGTDGTATDANEGPTGYEVFNYIGKDVLLGQVELVGESMTDGGSGMAGSAMKYLASSVLLNGLKLGVNNPVVETVTFGIDAYDKGETVVAAVQGARTATQASAAGATAMQGAAVAAPAMGALGKLNVATAAAGVVFGTVETFGEVFGEGGAYDTWHDSNASGAKKTAEISDATASFGSTLMSAGVVAAAIPGGQALGVGLVIGGAALWGVSKLTGYVANNWTGIKSTASKVGSKIADGWNSFTGLFG